MPRILLPLLLPAALLMPGVAALTAPAAPTRGGDAARFFTERVQPILARRCLSCHSGKSGKPQGGLALDTPDGIRRGGASGPALHAGDPDRSLLIQAVRYQHNTLRMPPAARLPAPEIDVLARWVAQGAVLSPESNVLSPVARSPHPSRVKPASGPRTLDSGPRQAAHWSFRPLTHPEPPAVKASWWPRTPIDRFILAKLEASGLKPSPYADRRTLIRRAYFDLIGLPPAPEEVDAFINDRRPGAWERVVDRLLASPHYGERWGRHWLDVVHYGDTHGYDKDKRRDHAWPYRDYVIRSLNEDRPYPRFIKEQLAGDVLYPDDPDALVATGFIAAGPWDFVGHVELREGTVEKEKTRVLDRDDMVANALSTFNSVTIHCARCHDHKFDPIPQKDYYRLQAVFSGVERGNRPFHDRDTLRRKADLGLRRAEWTRNREDLLRRAAAASSPELDRLDAERKSLRERLAATPQPASSGTSPTNGWHSGVEARPDVEKWVQIDLGRSVPIDAVRLLPARPTDFRDTPGFGFPIRFRIAVSSDPSFPAAETVDDRTAADFPNPGDTPYVVALGGKQARYVRVTAARLWPRMNDHVFALAELQVLSGGRNAAAGAAVTSLDSIEAGRWGRRNLVDGYTSRAPLPDESDPAVLERRRLEAALSRAEAERRKVHDSLLDEQTRAGLRRSAEELAKLERELAALPPPRQVYGVLPRAPRPIRLLARGDVDRPLDPVGPGALSCLPGLPSEFTGAEMSDEGRRRAALAEWIASEKNPLTWRSIVNRVWHYHFGRGLVDTPNDFGKNGSLPTHPELVDWLAATFLADRSPESKVLGPESRVSRTGDSGLRTLNSGLGGRLKALHRLIMTSAVYQQTSDPPPSPPLHSPPLRAGEGAGGRGLPANPQSIDSENRLLWRMNRRRLDAEAIRDSVLAVSGKLDRTMGGPAFELFRFKDDHSPVYDYSAPEKADDPATWRRTVYRFAVRSVQNPFLESLDCADPNLNTPVRNTTLTALQALALLNNPFMVRQSAHFAERLEKLAPDPEARIDAAYRLAFGRPPDGEERAAMVDYARRHGLVNACRLLLNANEFVFVD